MNKNCNNQNVGHRTRIKQKFVVNEDNFLDYELLELLLCYSIPRRDVKTLAKDLIKYFGSFKAVVTAPFDNLIDFKGLGYNSAVLLKLSFKISQELLKKDLENQPIVNNWQQLTNYCFTKMAFNKNEQIYVIYLNSKNFIIKDEVISNGSIDYANFDVRKIIEQSLKVGAVSIILAHNHHYEPSQQDIKMTKELYKIAKPLNIFLYDHLIVSKKGVFLFP